MEFKFLIDTEQKVIIETFYGNISLSMIEKAIPHILNHPDYDMTYDGIIDLRKANIKYSKEELLRLVKTVSENEHGLRGRAAVLVSEPMSAALATLYGEEIEGLHSVGVFCSESEVQYYLGINTAIFNKVIDSASIPLN